MKQFLRSLLVAILFVNIVAHGVENSGNTTDCCKICCEQQDCCYKCNDCCLGPCDGYPFLLPRSQGRNAARELVGWQQFINRYDMCERYGAMSITVEYTRTTREERIAQFLFGSDLINCCELYIQGSDVKERNVRAWDATYFGLPSTYDSRVRFCPRIENVIIDLNYFAGLDDWKKGAYLKINAPIVWTRWQLCMNENIIDNAENKTIPAGLLSNKEETRKDPATTFQQVMSGCQTYGDMQTPMKYGLIHNCKNTKTRLAEIDITFGHNWYLEEDYHLGGTLYVAIPTGNRPRSRYLFEPIVGNGKHWELGVGLSASYILWRDCDCGQDRYMGIWMDATVAHLFKDRQCRSFDFCKKPNSRYMLLAQMGSNTDEIKTGVNNDQATTASYQYKSNLIPAINWSTFNVDVRVDVQADIAMKFGCIRDNWTLDLGYNFWARTGEKFTLDKCLCSDGKNYAIKGNAYMYGQTSNNGATIYPIPFSQSMADIHGGAAGNGTTNLEIDNKQLAWSASGNPLQTLPLTGRDQIYASEKSLLVTRGNLNVGKSPSSITHKFFGHIGYAWKDRDDCDKYIPFIGIGGEAEFAMDNHKDCCGDCYDSCCNSSCGSCSPTSCTCANTTMPVASTSNGLTCCSTCGENTCCCKKRGGISQWGVWVKMGVSFE